MDADAARSQHHPQHSDVRTVSPYVQAYGHPLSHSTSKQSVAGPYVDYTMYDASAPSTSHPHLNLPPLAARGLPEVGQTRCCKFPVILLAPRPSITPPLLASPAMILTLSVALHHYLQIGPSSPHPSSF